MEAGEQVRGCSGGSWQGYLRAPERPAAFHCAVVEGEFIHAGTTRSFRTLAARSGGVLDTVVGGECKVGHEAVILECDLEGSVFAGRGAILHGLTGLTGTVEVPEDTVVHQLPVEIAGKDRMGDPRLWCRGRSETAIRRGHLVQPANSGNA